MTETTTADGIREQLQVKITVWVNDSLTTLSVIVFLVLWAVLTWFVPLGVSDSTATYWFFATADPSPGWILAAFSHASVTHLAGNLGIFLLFGAIIERRLTTHHYLRFLLATATAGILVQVVQYNLLGMEGSLVGASGAAYAVLTFGITTLLTQSAGNPFESNSPLDFRPGLILCGFILLIGQLLNDFTPYLTITPNASGVAHLTGILLGAGSALYLNPNSNAGQS